MAYVASSFFEFIDLPQPVTDTQRVAAELQYILHFNVTEKLLY